MQHDWILDVLADLGAYAERNGMKALAEHLEQGQKLALTEIASMPAGEDLATRAPVRRNLRRRPAG